MKILNQISVFILLQGLFSISQLNGQSTAYQEDYTSNIIIDEAIINSPDFKYGLKLYTEENTNATIGVEDYSNISTYQLIYYYEGEVHPLKTDGSKNIVTSGPFNALLRIGTIGDVQLRNDKSRLLTKPKQVENLSVKTLLNDVAIDQSFILDLFYSDNITLLVVNGDDKKNILKAMDKENINGITPYVYFVRNRSSHDAIPVSKKNYHEVLLSSSATTINALSYQNSSSSIKFKILLEYPDYTLDTLNCQYDKSEFPLRYFLPVTKARYWYTVPPKIGDQLFLRLDNELVAPSWNNFYRDFENYIIEGENIIRLKVARSTKALKFTIVNDNDIPPTYKSKVVPYIKKEQKRKLLGNKNRRYIELTAPMLAMPTDSMLLTIVKPFNYTISNSNSPLVDYSDWQLGDIKIDLIRSPNTILHWKKLEPLKVFYVDLSDSYSNREVIIEKIIKEASWIRSTGGNYIIYISNQSNPFVFTETDEINRVVSLLRELEPFPPTTRFDVETLASFIKAERRSYEFNLFLSTSIYENSLTQLVSKFLIEAYGLYEENLNEDDINGILMKINKKTQKAFVNVYSNAIFETTGNHQKSGKQQFYFNQSL